MIKKSIIIAAILLTACLVGNAYATIPAEERNALIELYNSTNGANWTKNTNWLGEPGTECTWYGIICDAENSHVTMIYLQNNQLTGSLPSSLGNLSYLERIVLWGNQLAVGIFPVWIENFSNLIYLDLSGCGVTGNLPAWLGNFPNLSWIFLGGNQLTGAIPPELGNLSNLEYFVLWGNQLSGVIPESFGNLSNLLNLSLEGNQLTGTIPASLGNLVMLDTLSIHSNQLTGNIPSEIGNLTNLRDLRLSFNQLTGEIPVTLGNLTNLEIIYLCNNQLTGAIPAELGNLTNLIHLQLCENQLTGNIPVSLGNLSNLKTLYLYMNQLTGIVPASLGNLLNLEELYLYVNQLTGDIPAELGNLISLKRLSLGDNHLAGRIPASIGNLLNLEALYLWDNQLSGEIPPEIINLTNLIVGQLNIRYNMLSSSDPDLINFLNSRQINGDWESTQFFFTVDASFSAFPVFGKPPLTVVFSDRSSGYPSSWKWDFNNDGVTDSTEQNPSFTYDKAGIYSVRLVAENRDYSDDIIAEDYIEVTNFRADFTADGIRGNAPFTVQFTDQSFGSPTSWQWDFDNDGLIDSTEQNPTFIYYTPGNYSVKLVVSDGSDANEETKLYYIQALATLPDLQVVQIQNSQAISGQTLEVTWTITNNGSRSTNTPVWYDRIWISPDIDVRIFQPEDVLLGEFENLSFLAPGESYVQTKQVKVPDSLNGVYYLFVITDNYDAYSINTETMEAYTHNGTKVNLVSEINDRNNINFREIQVTPPPPADLVVTSISALSNTFSGERINVAWTVKNNSANTTNASSWWDGVYISQDAVFNPENATLIGKAKHAGGLENTGFLGTDETYDLATEAVIPQEIYGDYYIHVVTDMFNDIYEHVLEDNNASQSAISITLTPPPDLVITDLVIPDSAGSGQSVNIQWTVENQGPGEPFARSWSDRVYLSTEPVLNPVTAAILGSFSRFGEFAPGEVYSKDETVTIPNGLEGQFYIHVKTDWGNQVFEHEFEDNNTASGANPVQISLSPWADLIVTDIQIYPSVTAGEKVALTFKITNQGTGAAENVKWTDKIYISDSEQWVEDSAVLLNSALQTELLAPGESYTETVDILIPNNANGEYYIHVITDAEDNVYEHTAENNNIAQSTVFTVLPYPPIDLEVTNLEIPVSGSSGQPVNILWTVKNTGEGRTLSSVWQDALFLSSDTQLDVNDIKVGSFIHKGALDPQEEYTRSLTVNLPNGVSGA